MIHSVKISIKYIQTQNIDMYWRPVRSTPISIMTWWLCVLLSVWYTFSICFLVRSKHFWNDIKTYCLFRHNCNLQIRINDQRHVKKDIRTLHIVLTQISPIWCWKHTYVIIYANTLRYIIMWQWYESVKKYRPISDVASETKRLVWVYTFCICSKVPICMMLAKIVACV